MASHPPFAPDDTRAKVSLGVLYYWLSTEKLVHLRLKAFTRCETKTSKSVTLVMIWIYDPGLLLHIAELRFISASCHLSSIDARIPGDWITLLSTFLMDFKCVKASRLSSCNWPLTHFHTRTHTHARTHMHMYRYIRMYKVRPHLCLCFQPFRSDDRGPGRYGWSDVFKESAAGEMWQMHIWGWNRNGKRILGSPRISGVWDFTPDIRLMHWCF